MNEELKYNTDEDLIKKTPNSFLNHPATPDELELMKQWLENILSVYPEMVYGISDPELQQIENTLGIALPSTLRLLYSYIGKNTDLFIPELMNKMDYKLVSPDQLKIEKDVVIHDYYSDEKWYKTDILIYSTTRNGKKAYGGIDIKRNWYLYFYKQWYWQKDHMPLYMDLPVTLACIVISKMQNVFTTKVKGLYSYKAAEKAEQKFAGYMERFKDCEHYDHTLFFNKEHCTLGWFRTGCAGSDIFLGSNDKQFVDDLIAKMEFSKAKHIKTDGVLVKKQ
ncbi:hypothetical protein [Bacteroides sp. 519]|uniref:hypothetical protein n=1 Tax=Bacteroides sp. 519 TaxID=2302937 RepID=UPI0013D4326C|nr:hypothetical protein [Bacteroides sp. 519]